MLENIGHGRFGRVCKGQYENRIVAVKVFPAKERQSWLAEKEIFQLPQMDHQNILKFIGISQGGENIEKDFYLLTEYHEKGT